MSDVRTWLDSLDLGQYGESFEQGDIAWELLPQLDHEVLKELGVASPGHRLRILKAAASLADRGGQPASGTDGPRTARAPDSAGEAERRQLTVMFCDLVGSTALAGRFDPEDLADIVRAYQDACAGVISRFEGYIARYMGDGMLVYFGYPRAHEDDAERALRAGLEILDRVSGLRPKKGLALQTRIGVATGLVVVGETIGRASSQEQVVLGETPNLAARLQSTAEPNQLVVSEVTRRLAGNVFEFTDLGEVQLKGFAVPQHAYRVMRERGSQSRFEARWSSVHLPMIGREQELELLMGRWAQAKLGEGQMVILSGEAGIGKSRITQALMDRVSDSPHVRIRYQCSPYHADSALHPAIQHIVSAASITGEDSNDEALDKLEAAMPAGQPPDRESLRLFADLLGLQSEVRYGASDLTPQRKRARTLAALVEQFHVLASQNPVLWVIEDMHWIDPTTLELIGLCLDQIGADRTMVVATARPSFGHRFGGHPVVTRLTLNRLGRQQVNEITKRLCGDKRLPEALLEKIADHTDGIPLFVEELTKTVLESSLLSETDDSFELKGELDRLEIPNSLQDSLMARLDRLEPLKDVAQTAACIGREFDLSLLAEISPLGAQALDEALEELIEAELVFRRGTGERFIFKHALVRDAAYESLLNARRQALHAKIVAALEKRTDAPSEILAHHATQAGQTRKAIGYWKQTGALTLKRPAYQEAISQLRNAVRLTGELEDRQWAHEQELELQIQISQACIAHKGWAGNDTDLAFQRALELVDLIEDTPLKLPAIYGKFAVHYVRGEECRALAERFQTLTETTDDTGVELVGWRIRLLQHLRDGEFHPALELANRSLECYDYDRHRGLAYSYSHDARTAALVYGSWALWHLGFPDRARATRDEALKWAEKIDHASTTGLALCWGGAFLAALERDTEKVSEFAKNSIALAETLEMPLWLGWSRAFLGWALSAQGDVESGLRHLEQGISELRGNRCMMLMPILLGLSAEANAAAGHLADAHRNIDEAFDTLEKTRYVAWEPHLRQIRGELLLAGSGPDRNKAEEQFLAALEWARARKVRMIELKAATGLASIWAEDGAADRAVKALSPVYRSFTEGANTPDLIRAKRLLDRLA